MNTQYFHKHIYQTNLLLFYATSLSKLRCIYAAIIISKSTFDNKANHNTMLNYHNAIFVSKKNKITLEIVITAEIVFIPRNHFIE